MQTRICLATYRERLAVVFDSASYFQIFLDTGNRTLIPQESILVKGSNLGHKLDILCRSKTNYLLCGALCKRTKRIINQLGIEVIDWLRGDISQIIQAWHEQTLEEQLLPGCRANGMRCCELPRSEDHLK